jgi:hypothetical protein
MDKGLLDSVFSRFADWKKHPSANALTDGFNNSTDETDSQSEGRNSGDSGGYGDFSPALLTAPLWPCLD